VATKVAHNHADGEPAAANTVVGDLNLRVRRGRSFYDR
jgi:hypothetical protein